jgi:hypothetical protein
VKLHRILAASGGVALIGASAFAFAAPATAADIVAPAAPFPAETTPYAAGWFTGAGSTGTSGSDAVYGLTITALPIPTSTYQVLNGTPVTGDLTDLVESARVYVTRGVATFQIPVFGEPGEADEQFTTLRPVDATVPGAPFFAQSAAWTTSQQLGSYAPGTTATLAEFEAALDGGVSGYEILGFGAAVGNGQTGSISQIMFAGNTHLFRAAPTGTQSATTVTQQQFDTTGVTFTLSGFVPNERVITSGRSDFGAGIISEDGVADANGDFTFTFQGSAGVVSEPGANFIAAFGGSSGFFVEFPVHITANPAVTAPAAPAATAAAPRLAATGTDLTGGFVAAGVLLLAGSALGVVALRRRSAKA